jgi:hypothetical protein
MSKLIYREKKTGSQAWWLKPVTPNYSGGRDQEDQVSRSAPAKKFQRSHLDQWLSMVKHICLPAMRRIMILVSLGIKQD